LKILLPYSSHHMDLDGTFVTGGVEKFIQLLYHNLDAEVIPVPCSKEEQKTRTVTSKVVSIAKNHDVDVIVSNYDSQPLTNNLRNIIPEVPVMWISHTGANGISIINKIKNIKSFVETGGTLFLMSERQYLLHNKKSQVHNGCDMILNGGYINSAFCTGDEAPSEIEYDAVTVGRLDPLKNPFWLHRKMSGSGRHSLIMSTYLKHRSSAQFLEYKSKNEHWKYPQETVYDLPYKEVMDTMSKGACYVSTCYDETWGITALESLAHGLPLVLVTDKYEKHGSDGIPASMDHVRKVRSTISKSDFIEIVDHFKTYSMDQRREISDLTKEKHTREKWKSSIMNAIDKTIENNSKISAHNLMSFTQ